MKYLSLFFLLSIQLFAGQLKVAATSVPHAEILNFIKGDLKKEGVDLRVMEFSDYIIPNEVVLSGEADANFFQHIPYLETIVKNPRLVSVAKIHVEALGLYSNKVKSLKDLKDKSLIAIPSESTNGGRSLILLHNNGIIKLKDPKNLLATIYDIAENPKNLKFKEVDDALLPRTLDSVDAAIITANYALQGGFQPDKDAILLEDTKSPYANVLVVRADNVNKEDIKKLTKAITSDKVRDFINNTYKGAVVPAF